MNPNKALWEKGDFTRIAATMRESGEAFAKTLGITPGIKVLDVGCGDGTTALPQAQLGADVLGVDIASNLVVAGRERARAAGLANIGFQEGDASKLSHLSDQSFDDPTLVAQILKISAAYSPPPPEGFISHVTWGVEADVAERFTAAGVAAHNISCTRETYTFRCAYPPASLLCDFRNFYGPTMNAFAAAEANGRAADLHRELEALFIAQNTSGDPETTSIPATFLRVTVTR